MTDEHDPAETPAGNSAATSAATSAANSEATSEATSAANSEATGATRPRVRMIVAISVAFAVVVVATGFFVAINLQHTKPVAATTPAASASNGPTSTEAPPTATTKTVAPTTTPTPTAAPDPVNSRPATAPAAKPVAAPYITSPAKGSTVAEGDVASPKGSIHFHYRMVSNGDNTYSVQYSAFTSTLPVPVGASLFEIAPSVGDGLTYMGVADRTIGGPTTTSGPIASGSIPIASTGQPTYLTNLVVYSAATAADAAPTEIANGKVLAVATVRWAIPARTTNVHPVDSGAHTFAAGTVTSKTAAGAPRRYLIASGDLTENVAARFGIPVQYLIWLNPGLQVYGDQQYLYSGTTISLDPAAL